MAVTVVTPPTGTNLEPTAKHDEGKTLFVKDGHLYVQSSAELDAWATLAVYAPGKWVSARVEKADS